LNLQIGLVLGVLATAIVLFSFELLRVDVVAILIMILLGWLGLVKPLEAFSGLASNAVVSVIAVMILGFGMDRSGAVQRAIRPILRLAKKNERRLTTLISAAVGGLSAFMQNIGAIALFLPAMLKISRRTGISTSRLLMPVGFAAILGGTLSMVGSGPLIILNDLLRQGGQPRFGLFSVTPVGLALLAAGIGYFLVLGRSVLPEGKGEEIRETQQELIEDWSLPGSVHSYRIPESSPIVGKTVEEVGVWEAYGLNVLAITEGDEILYAPWRQTHFSKGQRLALIGEKIQILRFAEDFGLQTSKDRDPFDAWERGGTAGFAEIIIPPRSPVAGKSLRNIALRKTYGVEPVLLLSGEKEQRGDFSDQPLQVGDALIVNGRWTSIKSMCDGRHFVLVTPVEDGIVEKRRPLSAILCFLGGIGLAIAGFPLSISLISGALAMVLFRVITIDEAYRAVDWRTVFLLAGLIPLGIAMDRTGAAAFVANRMLLLLGGSHVLLILAAVAGLSTLFSLFMSNVAATVLLVPLVMLIGGEIGVSPRGLALLVAVCASNSFVLPTHQVNALLMSPGGYRNRDFVKAGGIMTLIFLVIAIMLVYFIYIV
jgi:di/tricarboxylate transporter